MHILSMCHCAICNVGDANARPIYELKFYHVVAVIATNCLDALDEEAKWEKLNLSHINFVVSVLFFSFSFCLNGYHARVRLCACVRVTHFHFVYYCTVHSAIHHILFTLCSVLCCWCLQSALVQLGTAATIKNLVPPVEGGNKLNPNWKCWEMIRSKSVPNDSTALFHWDLGIILFVSYKFMDVALCGNLNSRCIRFLFRRGSALHNNITTYSALLAFCCFHFRYFSVGRSGKHLYLVLS